MSERERISADNTKSASNLRVGAGLPGPGRPKGVPNKLTMSAKEAFQHAFDALGGQEALAAWAREHPDDFYRLYSRQLRADPAVMAGAPTVFVVDRMGYLRRPGQELAAHSIADDLKVLPHLQQVEQ